MKLILENWRRYLKENNSSTKYFGPNPDETPCIMKLRKQYQKVGDPQDGPSWPDLAADVDPKRFSVMFGYYNPELVACLVKSGYEFLGAGGFRAVFGIPGYPELVLKVALIGYEIGKHASMNREEASAAYQKASEMVPKVYAAGEDHLWIISDRVIPIESWDEALEYFPVFQALVKEGVLPKRSFGELFNLLIHRDAADEQATLPGYEQGRRPSPPTIRQKIRNIILGHLQGLDFAWLDRWSDEGEELTKPIMRKEDEAITDRLINAPMFANIRDLLGTFDAPSFDIRPRNIGYAIRNGQKQFVILDPGFEL